MVADILRQPVIPVRRSVGRSENQKPAACFQVALDPAGTCPQSRQKFRVGGVAKSGRDDDAGICPLIKRRCKQQRGHGFTGTRRILDETVERHFAVPENGDAHPLITPRGLSRAMIREIPASWTVLTTSLLDL